MGTGEFDAGVAMTGRCPHCGQRIREKSDRPRGRPPGTGTITDNMRQAVAAVQSGKMTITEAMATFSVSRPGLYKARKQLTE